MSKRIVSSEEALHHALKSLTDGPGDPRSVDGAKVNAMQSIAWSLVGLLAREAPTSNEDQKTMRDLVDRAGVLTELRP